LEHLSIPSWLLIGRDGNVHHLPLLFFPWTTTFYSLRENSDNYK
jgi:hypothetical protein